MLLFLAIPGALVACCTVQPADSTLKSLLEQQQVPEEHDFSIRIAIVDEEAYEPDPIVWDSASSVFSPPALPARGILSFAVEVGSSYPVDRPTFVQVETPSLAGLYASKLRLGPISPDRLGAYKTVDSLRFDEEGISIPYPQQEVHMRQVAPA